MRPRPTGSNETPRDSAHTLVVLAKEPLPGRAKTRLQTEFSASEAASLASSAIEDTLQAVRGSRAMRAVLAWDGDPHPYDLEFEIALQPPGSLNARLAAAFAAVLDEGSPKAVLLIGMDTPQVTAAQLDVDWEGADAVLGLSEDGGFWAIGLRSGDPWQVFDGIPMSTERTGSAQLARLIDLGLSVRLMSPLRDVDLPSDADAISKAYPWLRFSQRHRQLKDARIEQPPDRLFDRAFGGAPLVASGVDPLALDVSRWSGEADEIDLMVVSRCEPPVVDLGCGPGRMVLALNRSGRSALGVDISAVAVGTSMSRGGLALQRRMDERLPAEGRWGTALLLDTNIGMGGDVAALLRRCCDLVGPGGLIICEVDQVPDRHEVHSVVLAGGDVRSVPILWGMVGSHALAQVAAGLDLLVAEEWAAGGRTFVTLRRGG